MIGGVIVSYLIVFLYIFIALFVSMILEDDSDSYDKESRKHKSMISACWPILIIYQIIIFVKTKRKS